MGSRSLCRPARSRFSLSGLEVSSHNEKLQDTIPDSRRRAILFGERPAGETSSLHTRLASVQAALFSAGYLSVNARRLPRQGVRRLFRAGITFFVKVILHPSFLLLLPA
jgi:hypothetical protein